MLAQSLLFFAFFAAFAVKVPMWPVHTWLPDAHVEAPTGGSVVLAAIMLKLGAYGFVRFSLPIAPDASHRYASVMIALSLIAVIYIGLVALVQRDMKKLVAYSSVAHMGFVTLGFFLFNELSVSGGLVQMISHGFVSGAMFLCIGVLYDRVHSREISSYGGVINRMPRFTAFVVLFAMANCGLPGTSGFVGEWMVILGTVKVNFWLGLLAATGADLGRGLHLVDGQAGLLRRGRERPGAQHGRHQPARRPDARAAGRAGAGDGPLPEAGDRHDARVGHRAAAARLGLEAQPMNAAMNWSAVYPEIVLLVMACIVALVDLWVEDPQRTPTYLADAALAGGGRADAPGVFLRRRDRVRDAAHGGVRSDGASARRSSRSSR